MGWVESPLGKKSYSTNFTATNVVIYSIYYFQGQSSATGFISPPSSGCFIHGFQSHHTPKQFYLQILYVTGDTIIIKDNLS